MVSETGVLLCELREKRPTVEAVRYFPGATCAVLHDWVGSEGCEGECMPNDVFMLSANVEVRPGNWVVRGDGDTLTVMTDAEFNVAYRVLAASGGESA